MEDDGQYSDGSSVGDNESDDDDDDDSDVEESDAASQELYRICAVKHLLYYCVIHRISAQGL